MRPIVLALPLLVFLPAGLAHAQVPGSYQRSCRGVSQDGPILSARCRRADGGYSDTSIDVGRCRGQPVANANGRLACGNIAGSSEQGRPRFGGNDYGNGYGAPPPPPPPRYGDPDDGDPGYRPPPRRPRYDPDQDY